MNTYGGFGNFASYGISAVSNLFTVNGMDDVNALGNVSNSGAMGLLLGQNEIQEVAVVSNGYSGEFGRLAGSNVDYVTRSGSNDFHGRATWYWNGRALNANNFFNNLSGTPRTFANANQYGADIGGPMAKLPFGGNPAVVGPVSHVGGPPEEKPEWLRGVRGAG